MCLNTSEGPVHSSLHFQLWLEAFLHRNIRAGKDTVQLLHHTAPSDIFIIAIIKPRHKESKQIHETPKIPHYLITLRFSGGPKSSADARKTLLHMINKNVAAVQVNEKNERTALKPQPKTWCKSDSLNIGHRFSHHHRFCCVGSVCGVRQKLCCWCDVGGICFRRLNSFRLALFWISIHFRFRW